MLDGGVVEGGVEHHDGEGENVDRVLRLKLPLAGREVLQHGQLLVVLTPKLDTVGIDVLCCKDLFDLM